MSLRVVAGSASDTPAPLASDQVALWADLAAGDQAARDRLLHEHLGLVYFVARGLARSLRVDVEFGELVSAGTLGLIAAVEAFDPERGYAFSTFAKPRIRGAILDELRRQDHATRATREKARATGAARASLAQTLGRAPTTQEIAGHLGVDRATVWRWQLDVEVARHVPLDATPADAPGADDLAVALADRLVAEPVGGGIEDALERDEDAARLRAALVGLPEQQRTVLALYYYEELTLQEIATILGRTESRVSQIRTQALATLRKALRAPVRRAA